MFSFNTIVLFFVIFSFAHIQPGYSADDKERFSLIAKNAFDDENLLFAKCVNTSNATKCVIGQDWYPDKKKTRACEVTIYGDNSKINLTIGIVALGTEKAVLYWENDQNNKKTTMIIRVGLKACKIKEISIPDAGKEALAGLFSANNTIVPYDDTSFDIFFNNPKRCGEKLCRLQVDSEGNAEPNTLNVDGGVIHYISPIATRSSSKGFAYLKKNDAELSLMILKTDGLEKELAKYTNNEHPVVSARNNVVTTCTKPNADSDISCAQYDEDGYTKFTSTIVDANKNIRPSSVYNLPDGGTLVMIAEFKECDQQTGCTNGSKYRVVKIAADGKIVGSFLAKALDDVSSKIKKTYIYKKENSKVCAAIIGQNSFENVQKTNHYRFVVNCFDENYCIV